VQSGDSNPVYQNGLKCSASASTEFTVLLDGKRIPHEHQRVYLGVTLDRSLTFRAHVVKTAAKVRTRNKVISKLASWLNMGSMCKDSPNGYLGSLFFSG